MARKKGNKKTVESEVFDVETPVTSEVTIAVHKNKSTFKLPDNVKICPCGCTHGCNKCPMCGR